MGSRASSVQRLADLRRVLEERRCLELQRASQAVALVEEAMDRQQSYLSTTCLDGRGALAEGDRDAWICAEHNRAQTQRRGLDLAAIHQDRSEIREQAMTIYRLSKIESDQASQLLREEQCRLTLHAARKAQALADDRYLSRKRWLVSIAANQTFRRLAE